MVNVHVFALWETRHLEAQSPENFSNVNNVNMQREKGFLPRGMTTMA